MRHSRLADLATRFVRNNGGMKLLAVCLAVAAWYAIRDATSFETVIKDVPLTMRLDEGWAVLDASVSDVDVIFRGSATDIRFLSRDQVTVDVDLRGKTLIGATTIQLDPRNARSPGGARPLRIEPSQVTLSLDREGDRSVPVKADIVGALPDGIEVERIECIPAAVTLHGPEGRLQDVSVLLTEPIDLEGRIRSFSLNKSVRLPADTWTARVEPDRVQVSVTMSERRTRRTIEGVRVSALRPLRDAAAIRVSPELVNVVMEGKSGDVEKVQPADLIAFVDVTLLGDGQAMELPVRVQSPQGIRVVEIVPPMVMTGIEDGDATP